MRTTMIILLSVALLISLAALTFAVQNTTSVAVRFLIWQFESSLALVLLIAFVLGALVMGLLLAPPLISASVSRSSLSRKLSRQESQLAELASPDQEADETSPSS